MREGATDLRVAVVVALVLGAQREACAATLGSSDSHSDTGHCQDYTGQPPLSAPIMVL